MEDVFDINKKIFNVGDEIFGSCVIKEIFDNTITISKNIFEPILICDDHNSELAMLKNYTLQMEHTTHITAYDLLLCYNIKMKFEENINLEGSGTIQNLLLDKDSLRYKDNARLYCGCDLTFVDSEIDIENIIFEEGVPTLDDTILKANNATLYTGKMKFLDSHAYYDYHFFNKLFNKLGFNQKGLEISSFIWDLSTYHDKQKYIEYKKEDNMWVINYKTKE